MVAGAVTGRPRLGIATAGGADVASGRRAGHPQPLRKLGGQVGDDRLDAEQGAQPRVDDPVDRPDAHLQVDGGGDVRGL